MGKSTKKPRGSHASDLNLNDVKDALKAKKNPNLKNLAKVAKNPRLRDAAKKAGKTPPNDLSMKNAKNNNPMDGVRNARNSDLKDLANKVGGGKFNPYNLGEDKDPNGLSKNNPDDLKDSMDFGQNNQNPFGNHGDDGQNPLGKLGQDRDKDDDDDKGQGRDKDDKDKDKGKDDKDKDEDKGKDKSKDDKDKDKDKDDKDKSEDKNEHSKKKKSDSENSAVQNASIVRRKPSNRRRKANTAVLKQGARILGKHGPEFFALQKAASFYDKFIAPWIKAISNRLANIGSTIKGWFDGATKMISGGLNAAMGFVGLSMAASTVSTISSLAVMLMLIFMPLTLVYFYILAVNEQPINELLNYTACVVKKAVSDDLDDDSTGGGASKAGQTTLAYLKKHNISAKLYPSSWNKTAVSIAKAIHEVTGLKTSLIYAQLWHECGGDWSYAAKTDNNFSGVTYTGDNKGYGGTEGSARPAHERGNYVHFKSINGYVCEYADTLMEISNPPGDKKSHIAQLKKMTTTKQFNDYLHLHKYYTADPNAYLKRLNDGLDAYNKYMKNGDTGSAKVVAVDYKVDSDSDSDGSSNDCKTEMSGNLSASRSSIVKEAKSWKGKFHYNAANRFFQDVKDLSNRSSIPANHTTDCSGFVWFVLARVGLKVPQWTTADMENYAKAGKNHLKKIDKEDALPGDIVIMNVGPGLGGDGHTAILTSKWGGSYAKTNVIQMGVWPTESVSTANIKDSFKDLLNGGARVTFARVTGLKKSSGGDDSPSKSKVITSLSKKENAARQWIVQRESGGNYKATNGKYYGAYQLDKSYLTNKNSFGGDGSLSKANQDYVAYKYMKSVYRTWTNAKKHWLANSWW